MLSAVSAVLNRASDGSHLSSHAQTVTVRSAAPDLVTVLSVSKCGSHKHNVFALILMVRIQRGSLLHHAGVNFTLEKWTLLNPDHRHEAQIAM